MNQEWGATNQVADTVIIGLGIAVLIVRQFIWRSGQMRRMLRMPMALIGAGLIYLVIEMHAGNSWVPGDWLVLAELGLVAITGSVMGRATVFRLVNGGLQYRLSAVGLILWAVFVAVRIGNFALAGVLGAKLSAATGLILLSFGINRLAAIVVVRRRARSYVAMKAPETTGTGHGG